MDTIMNYLNTMFATVAQTEQMQKIKNDLAVNMEDKYNELKAEGKSENEAVGTVISEFGNIDELLKDIGLQQPQPVTGTDSASRRRLVTGDEIEEYLRAKKQQNKRTAFGVVLILVGVMAMLLLYGLFEMQGSFAAGWSESARGIVPVVILLLTVVAATSLFIIAGSQFERYEYMEKGICVPQELRKALAEQAEKNRPVNTMAVTVGVGLCIMGVIVLLIMGVMSETYEIFGALGMIIMLLLIAVACYLFIVPGGMKEPYEKLLEIGDFAPERAKGNHIVGVVASVVWPVTVAAFLVWGLAFDGWSICWILFPAVGICFGGFAAACGALTEKK